MSVTADTIQSRLAAILDQNEATAAISPADYSLRLVYMNMAQEEWAESNQWQVLHKEFNGLISTASANASVVLPADFRQPSSQPIISYDGINVDSFLITQPQDSPQYESTQHRVEFLGNPFSGYIMRVYGTDLASGASVKVPYYSSPTSLTTTTSVSPIPNPDFLVKRTLAFWWQAREDARFPSANAEAQQILQNMITYENVFPVGSDYGRVKTVEETSHSFRWGQ